MELKYLVTGTGRCGTVFLARFLTSIGITCGHESVFSYEGLDNALQVLSGLKKPVLSKISTTCFKNNKWMPEVQWIDNVENIVAESSYMSAPFLNHEKLKDTKIIHLVRNPIKVVESFCNINYFCDKKPNNEWEEFIYSHAPELTNDLNQIDRCCLYYIIWNNKIEKNKINLFFKLEEKIDKLFNFLNIKNNNNYFSEKINGIWNKIDKKFDINSISDSKILFEFVQIGKKYGYSMIGNKLL